jgi:septum site-determining protein MinD
VSKIIVVTSGKGGVGKTTTSAAVSAGLAKRGKKTVVIDFDVGLRNLDLIMGCERRVVFDFINVIQGDAKLKQALIRDKRLDNLWVLPTSQTRDKDALTTEGVEKVLEELKGEFDFIVCDSPAGIERGAQLAMYFADEAIVVTNPEVSSVRDSDRVLGLLNSRTRRAEQGGEPVKAHALLTRYDTARVARGRDADRRGRAGYPGDPASGHHPGKPGGAEGFERRHAHRARRALARRHRLRGGRGAAPGRAGRDADRGKGAPRLLPAAVQEDGMSIFGFTFRPKKANTAAAAKERLQILLAHERADAAAHDMIPVLQREILEVIRKHMKIESDAVDVRMERGEERSSLEINIELPPVQAISARR